MPRFNYVDLFSVLFWRDSIIAGNHKYELGEITTEFLNKPRAFFVDMRRLVDNFVPDIRMLFQTKETSNAEHIQENMNAFLDVLFALPPYRDLNMERSITYNMIPSLLGRPKKWEIATTAAQIKIWNITICLH